MTFTPSAYPVFKRRGVPVTLYVSTYYVLDRRPVFDMACRYLLWKAWASGKGDVRDPFDESGPPLRVGGRL